MNNRNRVYVKHGPVETQQEVLSVYPEMKVTVDTPVCVTVDMDKPNDKVNYISCRIVEFKKDEVMLQFTFGKDNWYATGQVNFYSLKQIVDTSTIICDTNVASSLPFIKIRLNVYYANNDYIGNGILLIDRNGFNMCVEEMSTGREEVLSAKLCLAFLDKIRQSVQAGKDYVNSLSSQLNLF